MAIMPKIFVSLVLECSRAVVRLKSGLTLPTKRAAIITIPMGTSFATMDRFCNIDEALTPSIL